VNRLLIKSRCPKHMLDSHTWIIGYLANRLDLQQNGFEAIREVYHGKLPNPHEFDRVEYAKALHTVSN
jgi:hypothetical protein